MENHSIAGSNTGGAMAYYSHLFLGSPFAWEYDIFADNELPPALAGGAEIDNSQSHRL